MSRSLNKAVLIGNLTRDPELRYTPSGAAVCTFGLATNRQWTTDAGEKKEDVEFHRIVAWNKLAELCAQLLRKGRKVYIEGRLQTRKWTGQDNIEHTTTEIVISDMIILDSRNVSGEVEYNLPEEPGVEVVSSERASSTKPQVAVNDDSPKKKVFNDKKEKKDNETPEDKDIGEDIPF